MEHDFASRLRLLQRNNHWTVADMAERSGLPKRTLDKYMAKSNPSLPGLEAMIALARGLGVSLDWLALGTDYTDESIALLGEWAASEIALLFFESLHQEALAATQELSDAKLFGLPPELWAFDLGKRTRDKIKDMTANGVTKEDVLKWKQYQADRSHELLQDHIFSKVKKPHET